MQRRRKKGILFLYLKSGGGHLSAARTLAGSISSKYRDTMIPYLLNPIPGGASVTNFLLQRGYRFSSHAFRAIWIFLYEISKLTVIDYFWSFIIYRSIKKNLTVYLQKNEIHTIVILHFLLARPVKWVLRKSAAAGEKQTCDIVRIVTDPYTAHHAWFSRPDIKTIVFSKRLKQLAVENFNFLPQFIRVAPPMLDRKFSVPLSEQNKEGEKEKLNLRKGKKVVLFVGGGEGLPRGIYFLKKLLKSDLDFQIIYICGKDRGMRRKAERLAARFPSRKLIVFGFVNFMRECMAVADAVVCKAGPAIIRESLATGTPLIIIRYLYGQERGNMEYVTKNRLGYYTPTPKKMLIKLGEAMSHSPGWDRTVKQVADWETENGTELIVEELASN